MEELLTTKQAAQLVKVNPETIRRWVWRGTLPAQRIPGRGNRGQEMRIKKSDLLAVLSPNATAPPSRIV